jgi:hypothetical protein
MKITEIIAITDELQFNMEDYNQELLFKKYKEQDNVVAFQICEVYCYIIIKGKLKFFAFGINMDRKRVKRCKNIYEIINHKELCIVDKEKFGLLKKTLIIESLNKER